MGVRDGAACLPHSILFCAVIGPVLLTCLFVVIAAGRVVSVSGDQLVPGRRHGREEAVGEGAAIGNKHILIHSAGGAPVGQW